MKLDSTAFAVRRFLRARARLQHATDERWMALENSARDPHNVTARKLEERAEEAQRRAEIEYGVATENCALLLTKMLGVDMDAADGDLSQLLAASVAIAKGEAS